MNLLFSKDVEFLSENGLPIPATWGASKHSLGEFEFELQNTRWAFANERLAWIERCMDEGRTLPFYAHHPRFAESIKGCRVF